MLPLLPVLLPSLRLLLGVDILLTARRVVAIGARSIPPNSHPKLTGWNKMHVLWADLGLWH